MPACLRMLFCYRAPPLSVFDFAAFPDGNRATTALVLPSTLPLQHVCAICVSMCMVSRKHALSAAANDGCARFDGAADQLPAALDVNHSERHCASRFRLTVGCLGRCRQPCCDPISRRFALGLALGFVSCPPSLSPPSGVSLDGVSHNCLILLPASALSSLYGCYDDPLYTSHLCASVEFCSPRPK
jgi:hypothetical protein